MDKIDILFIIFVGICLLVLGFLFGLMFSIEGLSVEDMVIDDYSNCSNLSTIDTARCLINWVEPFYKYNLTDDSEILTLEDLKERGGDCKDWSQLYESAAKGLGFETELIVFNTRKGFAHEVVLIYKNKQYCIIDQVVLVGCGRLV